MFRDVEAQPHLFSFAQQYLLLVLVAQELENFGLVLLTDTLAFVADCEENLLPMPIVASENINFRTISVVERILYDVDSHLLYSF